MAWFCLSPQFSPGPNWWLCNVYGNQSGYPFVGILRNTWALEEALNKVSESEPRILDKISDSPVTQTSIEGTWPPVRMKPVPYILRKVLTLISIFHRSVGTIASSSETTFIYLFF